MRNRDKVYRRMRKPAVILLGLTGIGLSIWMCAQVPGGMLAFLLGGIGSAGMVYQEIAG